MWSSPPCGKTENVELLPLASVAVAVMIGTGEAGATVVNLKLPLPVPSVVAFTNPRKDFPCRMLELDGLEKNSTRTVVSGVLWTVPSIVIDESGFTTEVSTGARWPLFAAGRMPMPITVFE